MSPLKMSIVDGERTMPEIEFYVSTSKLEMAAMKSDKPELGYLLMERCYAIAYPDQSKPITYFGRYFEVCSGCRFELQEQVKGEQPDRSAYQSYCAEIFIEQTDMNTLNPIVEDGYDTFKCECCDCQIEDSEKLIVLFD